MNASCWGAISSTLIIPFRKPLNSNHISLDTFWYPGPPPIFPHHYCFRLQCHNFPKLPLSRISTSFTFLIIMICFPWSFFYVTVSIYTDREALAFSMSPFWHRYILSLVNWIFFPVWNMKFQNPNLEIYFIGLG